MAEALTDDQLRKLVDDEFENAMGGPGGEISLERADLMDAYLSEPRGDEEEGESEIVTSDVADVVDGIMPSLLRVFTIEDNLLSFDPVGEEDIAGSEQESDYVNYVFFKRNPAFMLLYNWCWDGLAQKNGLVKCWWDKAEPITIETYENLLDQDLPSLMEDEELEPIERSERQVKVGELIGLAIGQDVIDGLGLDMESEVTVHDIKFRRTRKRPKITIENVPPDEFRISKDAKTWDISAARFCGHEREVTRSELLEMGFDKALVESLTQEEESQTAEKQSRLNKSDEAPGSDLDTEDRSQDRFVLREGYIKADKDGDGRAELLQVFTCAGKKLSDEPIDRQPFHSICPSPIPHKFFGRATAEKVLDIQNINTELVRLGITNIHHVNNPGHAVWEQAMGENTLDDLLTTKIGSIKRFSRPLNEAWAPLAIPYTADSIFPMLELTEKMKRDRTGVSADSEGLSPEALKNIQQSVLGAALDLSRMKIEMIARIFAETGIKSLFLHIHELVRKHQQQAEIVRLRGTFVPVDPKSWRERYDMTVNIGLGMGNREHNLIHLNNIWEKLVQMAQVGGQNLTVKPKNMYNTLVEIIKNAGLKMPDRYVSDPGEQLTPPPSSEQEQLAQAQMQIQARQQELDAQRQALDQQRMELEHERDLAELERKRQADEDKFMLENEKLRNALTEMELKYQEDVPGSRV